MLFSEIHNRTNWSNKTNRTRRPVNYAEKKAKIPRRGSPKILRRPSNGRLMGGEVKLSRFFIGTPTQTNEVFVVGRAEAEVA